MTERCIPICLSGHISPNITTCRILDLTTTKDVLKRADQGLQSDEQLRKASEVVPPWMKFGEAMPPTPRTAPRTPQPPVAEGRLVQLAESRRLAADRALGPKCELPAPRIKLRGRTPQVPAAEESLEWGREARDLDQRALTRVLKGLQERLGQEKKWREVAEARLTRKSSSSRSETPLLLGKTAMRSTSSSAFVSLGTNDKALGLSLARGKGWYANNAAGTQATDRMTEMLERQPPYQRPKRSRPLSAEGAPYAQLAGI